MKCVRCDDIAVRYSGHTWYCARHYRILRMRYASTYRGKRAPSIRHLERLWERCGGVCPVCKRTMNWLMGDGASTVVTIQHDRSGKIRLLCSRCNARHRCFKGDSFYTARKDGKVCPCCKTFKTWDWYCSDRSRSDGKGSYCRACSTAKVTAWYRKNRERCNDYQRERWRRNHGYYTAARVAEAS